MKNRSNKRLSHSGYSCRYADSICRRLLQSGPIEDGKEQQCKGEFSPASASRQMQMCMACLQVCTTAATPLSKNKQVPVSYWSAVPCWQSWVKKCWEGREVRQHCGLPTGHLQALLLEKDAGFILPAHKFYGLSPEAAKARCGRWGGLGRVWHISLRYPSNKGKLHYLGARINELWMADHYPLIKTETQKPDETQLNSSVQG